MVLSLVTGITGAVMSTNLNTSLNAILGIIPMVAGLIIIFSERRRESNHDLEGAIYEKLITRNAYGHHTEPIDKLTRTFARGKFTPADVQDAIANAVQKDTIRYSTGKSSVSVNMSKFSLSTALSRYDLDSALKDRIEELRNKGAASGVR